ncbi:hypothetical protein C8R43DRAFT_1238200 [Mycena crocata]|nr:hypothetical protein C8R43DRAFT_1238200 [Mycena crocata]
MEADISPSKPQRVPELWFEDGNIVLQAGNSQFRVFRSILAARSPVFKDMFSFPQPTDSELVDGCPLVHFPDVAEDVTVFLKALLDPEFFKPYLHRTEFDTVVGCLRLRSHKYEVDSLRSRALVHLSSVYVTTLSWAERRRHGGNLIPGPIGSVSSSSPESAFYILATYFSDLGPDIFHDAVHNSVPVRLSIPDQRSFLRGYHMQSVSSFNGILSSLFRPSTMEDCTTPARCPAERLLALNGATWHLTTIPASPLSLWGTSDCDDRVCPTCLASLKETLQASRQKLWDKLPAMYGLPPWSDLEALRTVAIGDELAFFS